MEQETIKHGFETLQTCINDIHDRVSKLEPQRGNKHYFYNKDFEHGDYIVRCEKTGGTFSTSIWRLEKFHKQTCPCCGETIRRQTK